MDTIREAAGNSAVVERLQSLYAEASPVWGKMTVAQMLAHCQKPLLVAAGELPLKRGIISYLFGRLAKKKFVDSPAPFSKNGPTDPRFVVDDPGDFDREQSALIELVKRYGETGAVTSAPHPFFGPMSSEDWDRLMWKHLDHHLRQFGA